MTKSDEKQELIQDLMFNITYSYGTFLHMAGYLKDGTNPYDTIYEWLDWVNYDSDYDYYQPDGETKMLLKKICEADNKT